MLLSVLAIAGGLTLLVWGADRFVFGSSAAASNFGVSPLIIGLTVVGIGTSAPEMLVSATASWQGNSGIALGNAVGSNIANIGLVLGATAVVAPLLVHSRMLIREFPMLLAVTTLAGLLLLDGGLGATDGLILLAAFVALLWTMVRMARAASADPISEEFAQEIPSGQATTAVAVAWICVGLAVLLIGSRTVVWGAVNVAQLLGVSDLVIGLTIVAIGTSLPELAASVVSALKGEPDIALGNVIGSNMFNLLPVLAIAGLIAPVEAEPALLERDYPVMVALTIVLLIMAYGRRGEHGQINRLEGALMLLGFAGYQTALYLAAR